MKQKIGHAADAQAIQSQSPARAHAFKILDGFFMNIARGGLPHHRLFCNICDTP
jgi:hypothetical protein